MYKSKSSLLKGGFHFYSYISVGSVLIVENLDLLHNAAENRINIGSRGRIHSQGCERGAFRIEKVDTGERKTLGQIHARERRASHKYAVTDRGRIFGELESGNA
jgi:hypothetical protein